MAGAQSEPSTSSSEAHRVRPLVLLCASVVLSGPLSHRWEVMQEFCEWLSEQQQKKLFQTQRRVSSALGIPKREETQSCFLLLIGCLLFLLPP